jgi:hypothetical protein
MFMTIISPTQNPIFTNFTKTIGIFPLVFDDVFDCSKFHYSRVGR